jgi:hypothetical protein
MLAFGSVSWPGLVVGAVAGVLYSLGLETEIRADGIYFRTWPIYRSFRRISWAEIGRYGPRSYRPLREFGEWGIRWVPGKLAYDVSGDQGVWIGRTNGRSILVGSQRVEEFLIAIDEVYERQVDGGRFSTDLRASRAPVSTPGGRNCCSR